MYSLIFDTCFNKTYIVLSKNNVVLNSEIICSTNVNYHSVYLIPEIKKIILKNNIFIKDIDVIGINIGPGSFTGIRTGITVARVLCQQFNIKLVGISSLKILSKINNSDCIVALDARKNKVYFAQYKDGLEVICPCLIDKELLPEKIQACVVITDNSLFEYLKDNNIKAVNFESEDINLGLYLSDIVNKEISSSHDDYNWAKVKPLYIQPPSITRPKEKIDV